MKAAFIHSARLQRHSDGRVYSGGQFPYAIWRRYLRHFSSLTVITRLKEVSFIDAGLDESSGPGVSFIGIPDDHGRLLKQLRVRRHSAVLKKALSECDCLIVRSCAVGWVAAHIAHQLNIPVVLEVVGDPFTALWYHGSLAAKMWAPFAWLEARRSIRDATFVNYVTRSFLQERYPTKGIAACVSDVLLPTVSRDVLDARLQRVSSAGVCRPRRFRCGLMGDLYAKYKGLDIAIRAVSDLASRGVHVDLHVLGRGPTDSWEKFARRLGIRHSIHFDGTRLAGREVFEWLDSLDLYIQPSLTEGLPRSLIEAMSRGLPCLGSACGGIPQLLSAECLHSPGDYRQLSGQMGLILTDRQLRSAQAQRNFLEAAKYSPECLDPQRDDFFRAFICHVKDAVRTKHSRDLP